MINTHRIIAKPSALITQLSSSHCPAQLDQAVRSAKWNTHNTRAITQAANKLHTWRSSYSADEVKLCLVRLSGLQCRLIQP